MPRHTWLAATVETVKRRWVGRPGLDVAVLYGIIMLFFLVAKLTALSSILEIYTVKSQRTFGMKASGILWGIVEDLVTTTLLFALVLVIDLVVLSLARLAVARCCSSLTESKTARALDYVGQTLRGVLVFAIAALMLAPFAADMVLLQTRQMRFTFEFITMYNRDKADASSVEVDPHEIRIVKEMIAAAAVAALVFAAVYVRATDFYALLTSGGEPSEELIAHFTPKQAVDEAIAKTPSRLEESYHRLSISVIVEPEPLLSKQRKRCCKLPHVPAIAITFQRHRWVKGMIVVAVFVVLLVATLAISRSMKPVVAAIALNTTLNELFRELFHTQCLPSVSVAKLSARDIVHSGTETYKLFHDDVLYRQTTGFKGPLAFNVSVDPADLPNVLVLVVESFRYHDSLYLASNASAGNVLKTHNLTLTPNFDRWAKRGVAFSNMWSSWQTSRSVESILFAQIPLDSVTQTGTTTGRADMNLAGMPQFFKRKGYETVFSTGCKLTYDGWNSFFATHGFDTVLGLPYYRHLGETALGIDPQDWKDEGLSFNWGVHDDTSFELLGRILRNKTRDQQERVASGRKKRPFFMNHYTISSHTPFTARPNWYTQNLSTLPDFSPLYKGKENADAIRNYAEMRYFQDMTMGKFLDVMEKSGVLNDTILVIVGDHGQSPENGLSVPYVNRVSTTHVAGALIAEGRLSEPAVGLTMDDAVEHYDLLSTLADIVGVPDGGFFQSGVGRSLKRAIPAGSRPVWSNNPLKTLAVVRGHERFEYDSVANRVLLHDAAQDPLGDTDLFDTLPRSEQERWLRLRDTGRELNAYFKKRWKRKCITTVEC